MRVLVLGRLFSGLTEGLANGRWTPRGVPTFYKLVERLHADPEIESRTVLFCKEPDSRFRAAVPVETTEAGLVEIVPWREPSAGRLPRLDKVATEFVHMLRACWLGAFGGFDVIYATYALILPAAVLARIFRKPVVLRLMGVFPQHRAIARGEYSLFGWALKSPFRRVICTEDGSDAAALLPDLLRPGTPTTIRLNGCDAMVLPDARRKEEPSPIRIAFVGRLEPYKGCDHFLHAALDAARRLPGRFLFEIVGDGPLRLTLEAEAKGEAVIFHGAISHPQVIALLREIDIYVSVNLYGNLSNANLEALAAGAAMVIPTSDAAVPIDTATDRILPDGMVLRYERDDLPKSLTEAMVRLGTKPDLIDELRRSARTLAAQLLRSWTEVMALDLGLLASAAGCLPEFRGQQAILHPTTPEDDTTS